MLTKNATISNRNYEDIEGLFSVSLLLGLSSVSDMNKVRKEVAEFALEYRNDVSYCFKLIREIISSESASKKSSKSSKQESSIPIALCMKLIGYSHPSANYSLSSKEKIEVLTEILSKCPPHKIVEIMALHRKLEIQSSLDQISQASRNSSPSSNKGEQLVSKMNPPPLVDQNYAATVETQIQTTVRSNKDLCASLNTGTYLSLKVHPFYRPFGNDLLENLRPIVEKE